MMQSMKSLALLSSLAIFLLCDKTNGFQLNLPTNARVPVAHNNGMVIAPIQSKQISNHINKKTKSKSLTVTTLKSEAVASNESNKKEVPFPIVLWRFTRPHTLIGSALAIPALHIFAAPTFKDAFTVTTAISAIFAMIPSLLMNLYITGLNQITDVEIDKVNKPNLPIAAGDLSLNTAIKVVVVSLILSVALSLSNPILGTQGLNVALWGSMILGTMYSLPPFRLKRFPFLAAFCIVAVRGTIINAGFYAHAKAAAYSATGMSATVLGCMSDQRCFLSSLFFAVFGIVIALMKDVPDAVGDALFNIRSFTVRIGQKTVFKTMRRVLTALFLGVGGGFARLATQTSSMNLTLCRTLVSISAIAAGVSVRNEAKDVDAEDSGMVYKYYMHLWKLFYLSYLVLPFAR